VAASPERLVALSDGVVRNGALAGTAPRGRSPEEDERLGRELRESKKEQAEHAAVAVAVRAALEDVCTPLSGPEAPRLMRIDGLQHLETPFTAHLRPEHAELSVLDLVARLHPTPAVAGLPREAALAWIAAREGLERGWYAGPVGYVDAEGGGEFRVALRSGFVRNRAPARAWLYAGAGIVPGSEPESELRETRLKLRALLAPLTEI
jgi:isochorismate synthase